MMSPFNSTLFHIGDYVLSIIQRHIPLLLFYVTEIYVYVYKKGKH